jgi:hypothetical protein
MPCFTIKCGYCGRFCIPADWYTPFGCADPEEPEPYDPTYFCILCSKHWETVWDKHFAEGSRSGDWQKSDAEMNAARKAGLEWVHENGLVDTRTGRDIHYQYIETSEKQFYMPYLEYHSRKAKNSPSHP